MRRLLIEWMEFLLVVLVLATADPSQRSLGIGAAISGLGLILLLTLFYRRSSGSESTGALTKLQGHVRYPYFLGSALVYLGLGLAGRDPYAMAICMLTLTLSMKLKLPQVEAAMALRLGPSWASYRSQVPAILPTFFPYHERSDLRLEAMHQQSQGTRFVWGVLLAYVLLYACYRLQKQELFHLLVLAISGVAAAAYTLYYFLHRRTYGGK